MPAPTTWPGPTKPTDTDLALDAGVLLVGAAAFAGTRGGLAFDPGITIRETDWDGKTTSIAGQERVTEYNSTISGKILGFSSATITKLAPGATKTTVVGPPPVDTIAPINAATPIDGTTGYLTDVYLVRRIADGKIHIVHFPVARVTSYKESGSDKSEAEIDITIKAFLASTETDTTKCPYEETVTG